MDRDRSALSRYGEVEREVEVDAVGERAAAALRRHLAGNDKRGTHVKINGVE